jgi:tol-pal system protein YbgF
MFRKEMKTEIASAKKTGAAAPTKTAPPANDDAFEAPYKDAFDTFQKGMYPDAAQKFTTFVGAYPNSPLTPNAFFWLGEAHLMLGDFDKAILDFQELLDRWPGSDMAPKALLSQADAFAGAKDKKSSMTVLRKVMELYPKTEEAAIAERKLRNLNL